MIKTPSLKYFVLLFAFHVVSSKDTLTENLNAEITSSGKPNIFLNVSILLFTRQNQEIPFQFEPEESIDVLQSSNFNANVESKIIIGGWLTETNDIRHLELVSELLSNGDYNVFVVAWSEYALNFIYPLAVIDSHTVADKVVNFLKRLNEKHSYSYQKIHLIGHSLGAHIAGFIGARLNGQIARISGLDPANKLFEGKQPSQRLDHTDAMFVDVIHTSVAGISQVSGHVDFYPNGGLRQPNCNSFLNLAESIICNHAESIFYYINSTNTKCLYTAYQCTDYEDYQNNLCTSRGNNGTQCINMGYNAFWPFTSPATKQFYLSTNVTHCT